MSGGPRETGAPGAVAGTVAELLDRVAGLEGAGLVVGDRIVSWAEHVRISAARARMLLNLVDGAARPHVGVLTGNVPEVSYLLGAAAISPLVIVGLNTTRRGRAIAADAALADCALVLVDDDTARLVEDADLGGIPVYNIEGPEWAALTDAAAQADRRGEWPPAGPDDLMMLIFTSGTSGEPKAVRCTQRTFAISGAMLADRFGIGTDDVVYVSMPMFHSNAVIAGWSVALAGGASLVLRRRFSAGGFVDDVHTYGVTYANYVGKPLSYILATPARTGDASSSLRVMYGNEAAAADRAAFADRFGCVVVDGFGSTELGVSISRTPDTPPDALGPLQPPVDIVDPVSGEPVPAGAVGEIVNASGPGMFAGYYDNPEATADRMRGGVYHSGDLGWVGDDGFVRFAGRLGDWMRVDGENLGTGPIEQILVRHPAVREAAVFGVPVDVGDEVHAAIVGDAGAGIGGIDGIDADDFTEFLSAQDDLSPKQRPRVIHLVERMPETATFKTVRRLLRSDTSAPTWVWDGRRYAAPPVVE